MKYNLLSWGMIFSMYIRSIMSTCPASYSQISQDSLSYCVKCDTSCLTCYDAAINNCVTCPTDFTFNDNSSYCIPPYTDQINTVTHVYKYKGFSMSADWAGGTPQNCQYVTVLKASGSITATHTVQPHYKLRMLVSLWWLSTGSSSPIIITIAESGATVKTQSTSRPASTGNSSTYCADSYATNIDFDFDNSDPTTTISVTFSSSGDWGIRQYIFIQHVCHIATCATCDGPAWDDCLTCTDANRRLYPTGSGSGSTSQCRCDIDQDYFYHPDNTTDYCVSPCPSVPSTGQYYGDPLSQQCVLRCPDDSTASFGFTFADDVSSECVQTCPATITLGGQTKPFYYDTTNRRCVTNCPETQPYSWWSDRTCYETCPGGYYKYDRNMSCVSECPTDSTIALFADSNLGACVDDCEGDDWWADYLTNQCTDTCTGTDYFEDNTTTKNKCVQVCPQPRYFGNKATNKCIDYCYGVNFGDTHPGSLRHCVTLCNGSYFGLLTGTRACVETCPDQTWGQYDTYTCVPDPFDCDGGKYGDNYTHTCVAKGTCSLGRFSNDGNKLCVIDCPDGTFADQDTDHCQSGCTGLYFADPGINKCVQVCYTQNLYADVDSSNTCVARCNQGGSTPFRDSSTKTCVDVCPAVPDTYSDAFEESCVYNCSISLYKDILSDPSDKRCVDNCVGNWGDNSTGYGLCVAVCPEDPPLFGDVIQGFRVCVQVCSDGLFGDQDPTGGRQCVPTCPDGYFAQADSLRRCVTRCNATTFGYNKVCYDPEDCPNTYVGDVSTNLCTTLCPISEGTFADQVSKLCVEFCPINNSIIYFADPTDRWCRDTCDTGNDLYGNNDTQTCETDCIDFQAFADAQHPNRFCIHECTDTNTDLYYRNNYTKECVVSTGCTQNYFGDNSTKYCVAKCPFWNSSQTWGYISTQTCIEKCFNSLWGDDSTGIPLCIPLCPSLPPKWSYDPDMLCLSVCPEDEGLYGEDFTRTCVDTCPKDPTNSYYTYAYNGTRRCLDMCPEGTFSDYKERICWYYPQNCTYGWGDDYNNSCTDLCTGPDPWDSYGDNVTNLCTIRCSEGSYADNYTGTRMCVEICPGTYDAVGTPDPNTYDSFGDNNTQKCVQSCITPNTWADWQTHRCQSVCSGENPSEIPTYSQNINGRCVIALACPQDPDKLFGDNNTRSCVTSCYFNDTYTQWSQNLTRTCVPQCVNTSTTRYYGDLSTNSPRCIIQCPQSPRSFGQNTTNQCWTQCPDNTYGDQTGNRSCVVFCPVISGVIWFSQITQHICVKVCEEGTYGNAYGEPHCQTVATDCEPLYYGDNSTNLCVDLCPEDQNYFGDPSSKLCVDRCPTLYDPVVNLTANINMSEGHLYADYSTRLCVYRCPQDHGLRGTFGDNQTNTCVQRCPDGTFGDVQTVNRHCVTDCTVGTYADTLTNTCVSECPASPPFFGEKTNWTCVQVCPEGTWADASTRTCVETCPTGQFRLSQYRTECVSQCPSDPDLYGDDDTKNCVYDCANVSSLYPYADPTDRTCKDSCLPLFQYDNRCVKYCPSGYYADALGDCVVPTSCDANTYGDNRTTQCVGTCTGGSFADPNSRYCIAVCPKDWFGDINVCVQVCSTADTSASNITQVCESDCPDYTYHENKTCKNECEYGYANDLLGECAVGCPAGKYADPLTHDCVATCQDHLSNDTLDYFRNLDTGFCVDDCSTKFKDYITGNCLDRCSDGYWGYTGNYTCNTECVDGQYGYQGTNERTCYSPANLPGYASGKFGDPESGQYIDVCPTAPQLYYGDRNLKECVTACPSHSSTDYYGDPATRECQSTCSNSTFYTADPITGMCELRCSENSYRYNDTPICMSICPVGFADPTTDVCVAVCPYWADTFGFHNLTSSQRICVEECPDSYYAEPVLRTCSLTCDSPYFAYNMTHQCVQHCVDSFADLHNRRCMDVCTSPLYPNADNSTNQCVYICPQEPDYYADNNVCVFYCTNPTYFADPDSRQCVARCPNISAYNSYGNPLTGRCVQTCPLYYFGDNSTNKCVQTCPPGSFADNQTRKCVEKCPQDQGIYGDPLLHVCAFTCSGGLFGSQVNQECINVCDDTYWGDYLTTLCVSQCPSKTYSYGQNITRTCVSSCEGFSGFADNNTRLCRDICQDTLAVSLQSYADPTTFSCVQICPEGLFMENSTNYCVASCLTGNADNYSRYCVATCPDDPESYADQTDNFCTYECRFGQFSDNSTNLCVIQCPSSPDYYGDPHTGRCVLFCTEGSYAQNDSRECQQQCPPDQYADNLTRRCVARCPASEDTFGDDLSHDCVRVCPPGFWAQNTTQMCVSQCPIISSGTLRTYADNITQYCVIKCPFPYFAHNDSHSCIEECPESTNQFGHPVGRVCVSVSNCYNSTTAEKYFSDSVSRTCVQKCPLTLWADYNTHKCVATCVSGQFRNLHDQVCVQICPQDPDEYADPVSLNCVRKCQDGYYAIAHANGTRVCATDCKAHGKIKDNSTNKCVDLDECPTQPYMYADWNAGKCVFYCSINYFADNRTQACVPTCPAQWQYFGSQISYTCVSLCDDNTFADALAARTCQTSCSNNYFKDQETSTCVQRCSSIKPFYYEDIPSYSCVQICPGQSYAYNPNQTCLYTVGGESACPGTYYADRISKTCVQLCPYGSYAHDDTKYCETTCTGSYFLDEVTRKCVTSCSDHYFSLDVDPLNHQCVQFCPPPYFAQNSSKSCVTGCSSKLALQTTRSCQNYCPDPYYADFDLKKCVKSCATKFADSISRQCVSPCPSPAYSNPLTRTCDLLCPDGYFGRNSTRSCDFDCENSTYADPHLRICVSDCSLYPVLFADDRTNQCVEVCQSPLFAYTEDRTCVSDCPNVSTFIYLADQSNRMCVLECVNEQISFADYENNQCTSFCPLGTFASNLTKECVPVCPVVPNDTFSDNTSRICMDVCHVGSYGDPENLNCVLGCWWPRYADPTTRLCVQFCPDGYFAQNSTATCRATCLINTYADPSTHRCVAECPAVQDLFKYDEDWACVAQCPDGYYADEFIRKCVAICDSTNGMYAYDLTNQCLMECPVPYRGFDVDHTCILNCPSLYFYNTTRNVCTKCPDECTVCTGPYACLECQPGYNLFNGICNISCTPTQTLITYSNPLTSTCVQVCPHTYFGDNSSYTCTMTCPAKQYGQQTNNLCENCPSNCALCTSLTHCTSCESNATMAIDNMCYSDCNSTHKYYYGTSTTCYSACPDGTYLSYTNVHCISCSDLCDTCAGTASTCLSCHDRYYYNNTCLTECPNNYYGSSSFVCESCTSATNNICDDPLTFTTQTSIENYQYVVRVKFNHEVDIQKQIQQILKVKLQLSRRRMLDSATDLINNGVSYTYEILSDGTIKLYLILETNLDNPVFVVQFTDPTAIISLENGGTLQDTDQQITLDKVQYYPVEQGSQIGIRKAALFAVVFILILYALTFLWSDTIVKVIQLLQLLFFHALIQTQIPASLYFYLLELKLSLFQFLPNWPALSPDIPSDLTIHATSNQKTIDIFYDYNFFRNVGQIFFFAVLLIPFWLFFLILSNRRIVEHKKWHTFLEMISNRRFGFMIINDIFSVLYIPILVFGLYQFQELFGEGILGFNGFICLVAVLFCLFLPFLWAGIWFKKQKQQVQEKYPFLSNRLKSDEDKYRLQVPITYWYLLISCIWFVALYPHPVPQMAMLIFTNIFYIIVIIVLRPHLIMVNTIMTVLWCVVLITLESFILYFEINDTNLTSQNKTQTIFPFLIVLSVVLMVTIIWSFWRFVWQLLHIWRFFKKTQFYKVYGDPDEDQEKEESEIYHKYEKMVYDNEPKVGDIVVDKIYKECNDKGDNMIKVRKKVLKKKKKAKGRNKREEKKEIEDDEEQFVRINKVNPFDYNYDEEFKPKVVKESNKRTFDDDLRDMVSDQEDNEKQKKLDSIKEKIQVQDDEQLVRDIHQFDKEDSIQEEKKEKSQDFDYDLDLEDNKSDNADLNQGQGMKNNPSFRQTKTKGLKEQIQQEYESADLNDLIGVEEDKKEEEEDKEEEKKEEKKEQKKEQKEKPKGIDELLKEQESKKKNLLFLFDEFDEDEN